MKPPSVNDVTRPRSHSTTRMIAIVQSICFTFLSFSSPSRLVQRVCLQHFAKIRLPIFSVLLLVTVEPFVDLVFRLVLAIAITLLQHSSELFGFSTQAGEIIVGEFAPLLSHLPFELVPFAMQDVLCSFHFYFPFLLFPQNGSFPICFITYINYMDNVLHGRSVEG